MLCCCRADQKIQGCVLQMEKETYAHAHTDSFLFKAWCGPRATSYWYLPPLIYTMYTWIYGSYFTCTCKVLFSKVELINPKQVYVVSGFNQCPLLVSAAPVHWSAIYSSLQLQAMIICCNLFHTFSKMIKLLNPFTILPYTFNYK